MIDKALLLLKEQLNVALSTPATGEATVAAEDIVVFADGDKLDPLSFRLGAVTAMLINVDQEPILREANPYVRVAADRTSYPTHPDVRLNLNVIFVACYKQYEESLGQLSRIISFFQEKPVFDSGTVAAMPNGIDRLSVELVTLPLAGQNELWGALRATYQPSLLYRVRTLVFRDQNATPSARVATASFETKQIDPAKT